MGVTLGKSKSDDSAASGRFRRAINTVKILSKAEKDSQEKNVKKPDVIIEYNDYNRKDDISRSRNFLQLDDDKEDTRSIHSVHSSHNFVYRDTSDAWAALRAGNVPEVPTETKEFTVVDSALGGYKTVERTRVNSETEDMLGVDGEDGKKDLENELEEFSVPYEPPEGWDTTDVEYISREKCTTCKKTGILHSCRICDNAYHESCYARIGRLHDEEAKKFFQRALTNIGWSCHDCENLGSMLHQDDMVELIEVFEKADVDDDATIDLEEFIKYRAFVVREREHRELTADEVEDETIQFRAMDTDRTGTLSWWEFLDHEAVRRLAAKEPKHLVKLLTNKEINKARDNFRAFDTDLDGSITEYEARRAYKRWYSHFVPDPTDMTPSERRRLSMATDTQRVRTLQTHIQANTRLLMGADKDNSGTISWAEYLCEQALYIIAARPNVGPVHLKNRKPSFAR